MGLKAKQKIWNRNLNFEFLRIYRLPLTLLLISSSLGCSLLATRPVQEMSDTTAALRAAKEVQADTLAPELYRKANELFLKARKEYKYKNFYLANDYAEQARALAEQAEFEAIRGGGIRQDANIPDPLANSLPTPTNPAYAYPTPTGRLADPQLSGANNQPNAAATPVSANPTPAPNTPTPPSP